MGVDWVRFAEIGVGGTPGMRKLGSFRIFWLLGWWWHVELGSFRIFGRVQIGGDPDFEIPGLRRDAAVVLARL